MLKYPKKESGGQMNYLSDIEIAQNHEMLPITEIAKRAGIDEEFLAPTEDSRRRFRRNFLKTTGERTEN